jgi:hypothetical protein
MRNSSLEKAAASRSKMTSLLLLSSLSIKGGPGIAILRLCSQGLLYACAGADNL